MHREQLRIHRRTDVRGEARATLLAYAFLRGKTYKSVEPSAKNPPNWVRVRKLVEKYGLDWWANYKYNKALPVNSDKLIKYETEPYMKELLERFDKWGTVS